jgi:predicted PP-loop superfamily ATPase
MMRSLDSELRRALYWIKTVDHAERCAAIACGDMVMKGMAKVNRYSKTFRLNLPQKKGGAP